MKDFIVSLTILNLYRLVDTILTMIGLDLGLSEANPIILVDNLLLYYIALSIIITVFAFAVCSVERHLGMKHVARTTILLMTLFYVYVLIHNVIAIREVTT